MMRMNCAEFSPRRDADVVCTVPYHNTERTHRINKIRCFQSIKSQQNRTQHNTQNSYLMLFTVTIERELTKFRSHHCLLQPVRSHSLYTCR
jgi:hypothetical protein